tara:strand:+ start:33767 stop:34240 length:474 start_codon:yes stop_codon:yes gene_type:complete
MNGVKFSLLLLLTGGLLSGCSSKYDDGLVKQQVTGMVLVNGNPEKGIAVIFKHTDPGVTKNAARPVAITSEDGSFALSTNADKDGAIAGTYQVSFHWPESASSTRDFLDGKYIKSSSPEFNVVIGEQDMQLPPFELKASPKSVAAAHKALKQKRPLN